MFDHLVSGCGWSPETGVCLQYNKNHIGGPACEAQHNTTAQKEPVIGVVVGQTLQRMANQRPAQRDLRERVWGEEREHSVY